MKRLFKEFNGIGIPDAGAYRSKEFDSFYRKFVNAVKRSFPEAKVKSSRGHYSLSGFIESEGQFVYFSYNCPRGGYPIDFLRNNILIRMAKDEKDFVGRQNYYTNPLHFKEDVEELLRRN